MSTNAFDIAFIGHYTKDTIVYPDRQHTQHGGAYFFGASVAARMGLRVAVITRLAERDRDSYAPLTRLGVTVIPIFTPQSTCLSLVYPTGDLDTRTIYTTSSAGPFVPEDTAGVDARVFHVGASMRGEVPVEVIRALKRKGGKISLDAQGYVRVNQNGVLAYDNWPGKEEILPLVDFLKADSVEAERLTGEADPRKAAPILASWGPREVIITHGGGIVLFAHGELHEAPFVTATVRGRSGRGDTCTGAYLSRRLSAPPRDALIWAAAVTSLKLEKEGAFDRTIQDVEDLIRRSYTNLNT